MKAKWMAIAAGLLVSCSGTGVSKNEEGHERAWALAHRISSVTEYCSPVILGVRQKEYVSRQKYFDVSGFKFREIIYTGEGAVEKIFTNAYDRKGNLRTVTVTGHDNRLLYKERRIYDRRNRRTELYHDLPEGSYKYRNTASYDSQGRMSELAWYWTTGLKAINRYEYAGDKKIKDVEYSPDGQMQYEWKYKYDSADNQVEALQYYPGNVLVQKISYEYNGRKLLTKQLTFRNDRLEGYTTLEYDDEGLLTAKGEYNASGKPVSYHRYLYRKNI